MLAYTSEHEQATRLALATAPWDAQTSAPVRVYFECLTGDVLGSLQCDCGDQLHAALARIAQGGCGVLV